MIDNESFNSDLFQSEDKETMIRILNPLSFFASLIIFAFWDSNKNHKEEYPVYLYPQQYCLYIWFFIFILQGFFSIYSAIPSSLSMKRNNDLIYSKIGLLFALNWIFVGSWNIALYYDTIYTKGIQIFCILGAFIFQALIYVKTNVPFKNRKLNTLETITLRFSGSIYLAWLLIMLFLNISFIVYYFYFSGRKDSWINERSFTMLEVFIISCITIWITFRFKDPVIGVSSIWTFVSIILKNPDNGSLDWFLWTFIVIQGLSSLSILIHQITVSLKTVNDRQQKYFDD